MLLPLGGVETIGPPETFTAFGLSLISSCFVYLNFKEKRGFSSLVVDVLPSWDIWLRCLDEDDDDEKALSCRLISSINGLVQPGSLT